MALIAADFELYPNSGSRDPTVSLSGPPYAVFLGAPSYLIRTGTVRRQSINIRNVTGLLDGTPDRGIAGYNPRLYLSRPSSAGDLLYFRLFNTGTSSYDYYGAGHLTTSVSAGAISIDVTVEDASTIIFRNGDELILSVPQTAGTDLTTIATINGTPTAAGNIWTIPVAALPQGFTGGLDVNSNPNTYAASVYRSPDDLVRRVIDAGRIYPLDPNTVAENHLTWIDAGEISLYSGMRVQDKNLNIVITGPTTIEIGVQDQQGSAIPFRAFKQFTALSNAYWLFDGSSPPVPILKLPISGDSMAAFNSLGGTSTLDWNLSISDALLGIEFEQQIPAGIPAGVDSNWQIGLLVDSV